MSDPHLHVEQRITGPGAGVRDVVASAFGLAADAPSSVVGAGGCPTR